MGSGAAAPIAADFGGAAAPLSAPLMAGASAAIPNAAAGFPGAAGLPVTGDILTASAPSLLPTGASADMLAQGAMPTAVPDVSGWGTAFPGVTAPPGATPAYGAATDPNAAPPTAQQGLDYINQQFAAQGYAPFNPAEVATYDPALAKTWAQAQQLGTYTPKQPPSFFDQATQGLTSTMNNPWTRLGLAAAPLAIGLSGIGQKLPASAQQAQANYAALANQGANLNPSQQAVLGQMRQNLTNQWKQTLFNQGVQAGRGGVPMSTQWPQIAGLIDQQVSAAAQQMIQQNISNALQGNAGLVQLANLQLQEDRNFQQTLQNATRALGLAAGLGGTTKTVTTTTTGAPTM